ncbi:SDR family NAD(P)-dependent oxidoreductase [Tomitella biformata]|uniref:SDR family NAD(P)-dependent oxidoreductase n=1 Tax=Tomitella biformata TaxID=630403 RepID=UPI00046406F3|nr:SDR family NAD(P)-dependent oxidoreductase [Tomitella biformata]
MVSQGFGGTAVVTGASSGIGAAIARHAAAAGMSVVLADISVERLAEVAGELAAKGHSVLAVPTDVTDPDQVDALADAVYREFGAVELLVNNAGLESVGPTWDIPAEQWRRVLEVNVNGVFHGIRSFVPRMGADPRPSRVVNTSSVGGIGIMPRMAAYTASKHAVQALTECLYLECAAEFPQVKVSVFAPAHVATNIFEDAEPVPGATDEMARWRDAVREQGISAETAARLLFDGIARDEFWILTHSEAFERLAGIRARTLSGALRPGET